MPIVFYFDEGRSELDGGSRPSISWTESGVNFTLSANALNPGNETVSYYSSTSSSTLRLIDRSSSFGAFTLNWNDGAGNSAFDGANLAMDIIGVAGNWEIRFVAASGNSANDVVFNRNNTPIDIAFSTTSVDFNAIRFTASSGTPSIAAITLDSITVDSLTCYLEGTGVATPSGRVAVEDLRAGDLVTTADGRAVAVEWIGTQTVDPRFNRPAEVNPICICAGAIAEGVPSRDLYVSPDHAVEIDGYLVNAGALVNGSTIFQAAMPLESFTYYHIETAAHELLLAEDLAAESYVDAVGRERFDNGHERENAPAIREMALPRVAAARMLPADIKARMTVRADAITPQRRAAA